MFWNLVTKIVMNVLTDLLVGLLTKLVLTAGTVMYANYRQSRQLSLA